MIKVILSNGTVLNCCIYETGEIGQYPITNRNKINAMFNQFGEKKAFINFQTETINGKFHPSNVVSYEVTEEW